jgi:amidohydrolase
MKQRILMAAAVAAAIFASSPVQGASAQADAIDASAAAIESKVIAWRRDIHEHPELSNREVETSRKVAKHLKSLGLEVDTGVAKTGVVGVLRGGKPGPVVALRADMDALPVVEQTGEPFASKVRATYEGRDVGVMHACGHDTHVAILMGAAEVLAGMRDELPGTVKFIFQPAEEGAPKGERGGAGLMVEEGVLTDPDVDAIFGLHITQGWAVGETAFRPMGMMASAERFDVKVQGRQTHGAQPWMGIDPVVVGSQIVLGLQTVISRQVNLTTAPAVITVGSFHAGVRNNIVPDDVTMSGTIRTFDPEMQDEIHERMERTITRIAESAGATATLEIGEGVPVTFNDPSLAAQMRGTLEDVFGGDNVREAPRVTGAEDFSFYQEEVPGFFFFLGGRSPNVPQSEAVPNHSPLFTVDESALVLGVRAMSRVAADYLSAKAPR